MIETALAAAPLESARFGLNVHRGESVASRPFDSRQLLPYLVAKGVDVAILRGPAPFQPTALQRYGIPVLHADTLVHYTCDLARLAPRELRNTDVEFNPATPDDQAHLRALVASTFDSYRNHYHANPLFDPHRILEGYGEWAAAHVSSNDPRYPTWVARRGGTPIGFACCRDDGTSGEGVLYGVHPDHAGAGLYSDLIRVTQQRFAEAGRARMHVSTQVWNYAVQKVWSREGFWLSRAVDTWHVNSLLSAGDVLADKPLHFSHDQVAAFARVTGDANPLHLDDAAAREAGFEGRLSHGMLTACELSALFGMVSPGPGTLFLHASLAFIRPIYADRPHRLRVTALSSPAGKAQLAVAVVFDEAERPCLLAYCNLFKKAQ